MADQQTLAIVITAENAQAVASLNKLQKELADFEKSFKKSMNADDVLKFSKAIEDTKRKMEVLNNQVNPLSKITIGSNQAAQALTNVGRVAQDLPFGFMGIQNNLNPLLESFQRLKVETGSTKGALTALGSSLIGAGGIGLALSVASSAFLLFGDQLFATDKKAQAAKKSIEDVTASIAKDAAQVEVLVQQYKNSNLSLGQRESIIKQLNNIAPEYFAGLQAETTSFEQLTKASNEYTASLTNQIKAKILGIQLEQVLTDKMKAQAEQAKVLALQQDYNLRNKTGRTDATGSGELANKLKGYEKEENFLVNQIALLTKVKDLTKQDKSSADVSSSNIAFKQPKVDPRPLQEMVAVNAELKERLTLLSAISDQMQKQAQKEKEKAFFNIGGVAPQKTQALAAYDQKEAENKQRLLGIEQSRLASIDAMNKKLSDQKALAQGIGNSFANLFQTLAAADNPFEALSNAAKQLVIDLAAAVAQMLIIDAISAALNPGAAAAKKAGGAVGSIIGGGEKSGGGFFGKLLGSIFKFADGGIVSKPTFGMVGEAGTEAILPLDRFQGMLAQSFQMGSVSGNGGGTQTIVLDTQVRGNDLWFIQRKTDFSRGLKTGG